METTTLATTLNGNERCPDGEEHRGRGAEEFGGLGWREQERRLHGSVDCVLVRGFVRHVSPRGRRLRVHRIPLSRERCDWTHQSAVSRLRGRCRVDRLPSRQSGHGPRGDSTADALRFSGTRPYRPDERTHQLTGRGLRMSRATGDGCRTRSEAAILGATRTSTARPPHGRSACSSGRSFDATADGCEPDAVERHRTMTRTVIANSAVTKPMIVTQRRRTPPAGR